MARLVQVDRKATSWQKTIQNIQNVKGRWPTSTEDHISFHFCQPKTGHKKCHSEHTLDDLIRICPSSCLFSFGESVSTVSPDSCSVLAGLLLLQ